MRRSIKPKLLDGSKIARKGLIAGTLIFSTILVAVVLAFVPSPAKKGVVETGAQAWGNVPGESDTVETEKTPIGEPIAKVTVLDVGQGNCAVCSLPGGETIMVDAGPADKVKAVVAYLDAVQIQMVQELVISTANAEHYGGAQSLIEQGRIKSIYLPAVPPEQVADKKAYSALLAAIEKYKVTCINPNQGDILYADIASQVSFAVLSPERTWNDLENDTLVTKLTAGNRSFLFMGDAGEPMEQALEDTNHLEQSDVLFVGNHGSLSATSIDFLDAVKPTYAVISVKGDNSGENPSDAILTRLSSRGIILYRTDVTQTITIQTDGQGLRVVNEKGEEI